MLLFQFLKAFSGSFDGSGLNKAIGGFLFSQSGSTTVPIKRLEESKKVKKFLGLILVYTHTLAYRYLASFFKQNFGFPLMRRRT